MKKQLLLCLLAMSASGLQAVGSPMMAAAHAPAANSAPAQSKAKKPFSKAQAPTSVYPADWSAEKALERQKALAEAAKAAANTEEIKKKFDQLRSDTTHVIQESRKFYDAEKEKAEAALKKAREAKAQAQAVANKYGLGWQDAVLASVAAMPVLGLGAYNYWQSRRHPAAGAPRYGLYQTLGMRPGGAIPSGQQVEQAYERMHKWHPSMRHLLSSQEAAMADQQWSRISPQWNRIERAHTLLTRGRTGSEASAAAFRSMYHLKGDQALPENQFAAMLRRMKEGFMGKHGRKVAAAHWATPALIAALVAGRFGLELRKNKQQVEASKTPEDTKEEKEREARTQEMSGAQALRTASKTEEGRLYNEQPADSLLDGVLGLPNIPSRRKRSAQDNKNYQRVLTAASLLSNPRRGPLTQLDDRERLFGKRKEGAVAQAWNWLSRKKHRTRADLRDKAKRDYWFKEQLDRRRQRNKTLPEAEIAKFNEELKQAGF